MAITYGMSVKEFWEDSPDLFWAYRFSYFKRLEAEQEIYNQNAWLQGLYFHEAISVSLNNAFGKQKITYSKKPYGTDKNSENASKQATQSDLLVAKIKDRVSQVQAIKGNEKSSTTDKGNNLKGGEIINERTNT